MGIVAEGKQFQEKDCEIMNSQSSRTVSAQFWSQDFSSRSTGQENFVRSNGIQYYQGTLISDSF